MNLKDIFKKPVDRPIEGVIKADDEASLRLELEEYVLTNEVEKRLEALLTLVTGINLDASILHHPQRLKHPLISLNPPL